MKLETRQVDPFLRNPEAFRCVLLHGEDDGLIRHRAAEIVRSIAGSTDDPFRVSRLNREGHGRLLLEMTAMSLSGGRRVVLIHEATDAITPSVKAALASSGAAFLVIEAGFLPARSTLRALIERERQDAASIACYREAGSTLERTIRDFLSSFEIRVEAEALNWLCDQLGSDRGATRQELEKIAIYVGYGGIADLSAVSSVVGDLADLQVEDALFFATEGDVIGADRAVSLAVGQGATPVSVLRASLLHLQRLHRARAAVDSGLAPIDAARRARPPVYSDRLKSLTIAVRLWDVSAIFAACDFISDIERQCKRTGSPAELLCQNAIAMIARSGRSKRERMTGRS